MPQFVPDIILNGELLPYEPNLGQSLRAYFSDINSSFFDGIIRVNGHTYSSGHLKEVGYTFFDNLVPGYRKNVNDSYGIYKKFQEVKSMMHDAQVHNGDKSQYLKLFDEVMKDPLEKLRSYTLDDLPEFMELLDNNINLRILYSQYVNINAGLGHDSPEDIKGVVCNNPLLPYETKPNTISMNHLLEKGNILGDGICYVISALNHNAKDKLYADYIKDDIIFDHNIYSDPIKDKFAKMMRNNVIYLKLADLNNNTDLDEKPDLTRLNDEYSYIAESKLEQIVDYVASDPLLSKIYDVRKSGSFLANALSFDELYSDLRLDKNLLDSSGQISDDFWKYFDGDSSSSDNSYLAESLSGLYSKFSSIQSDFVGEIKNFYRDNKVYYEFLQKGNFDVDYWALDEFVNSSFEGKKISRAYNNIAYYLPMIEDVLSSTLETDYELTSAKKFIKGLYHKSIKIINRNRVRPITLNEISLMGYNTNRYLLDPNTTGTNKYNASRTTLDNLFIEKGEGRLKDIFRSDETHSKKVNSSIENTEQLDIISKSLDDCILDYESVKPLKLYSTRKNKFKFNILKFDSIFNSSDDVDQLAKKSFSSLKHLVDGFVENYSDMTIFFNHVHREYREINKKLLVERQLMYRKLGLDSVNLKQSSDNLNFDESSLERLINKHIPGISDLEKSKKLDELRELNDFAKTSYGDFYKKYDVLRDFEFKKDLSYQSFDLKHILSISKTDERLAFSNNMISYVLPKISQEVLYPLYQKKAEGTLNESFELDKMYEYIYNLYIDFFNIRQKNMNEGNTMNITQRLGLQRGSDVKFKSTGIFAQKDLENISELKSDDDFSYSVKNFELPVVRLRREVIANKHDSIKFLRI